jgi:hypothetical protein
MSACCTVDAYSLNKFMLYMAQDFGLQTFLFSYVFRFSVVCLGLFRVTDQC